MNKASANSQCLCGKIKLNFTLQHDWYDACHCGMCRKWGGGPVMTVHAGTEVKISGEENLKVFSSSDWAERAFCSNCGTHMFFRLKEAGMHFVPVGTLEKSDDLRFNMQIYIDKKPASYSFANETQTMTEAEVRAEFGL